jgi:hypothetical protein
MEQAAGLDPVIKTFLAPDEEAPVCPEGPYIAAVNFQVRIRYSRKPGELRFQK